jgi:hypothetical protein
MGVAPVASPSLTTHFFAGLERLLNVVAGAVAITIRSLPAAQSVQSILRELVPASHRSSILDTAFAA